MSKWLKVELLKLQTFKELETFNKDKEFIRFRERNLRSILMGSVLLIVGIVLSFHYIDRLMGSMEKFCYQNLLPLRLVSAAIFLVILITALIVNKRRYDKFSLHLVFYVCTVFSAIFSVYAGGIMSAYWAGLNFFLIVWFVLVPFSYKMRILNAISFAIVYFLILYFTQKDIYEWGKVYYWMFYVSCTMVIGSFIAIFSNKTDADLYFGKKALRENEEMLGTFVAMANDGIVIISEGLLKFTNEAFCKMCGYSKEQLLHEKFIDLLSEDERVEASEIFSKLCSGEAVSSYYKVTMLSKAGEQVFLELNSSLIEFEEKKALFVIVRNITQSIKSEQALRDSENKYRNIFDTAGDAIFLIDTETTKIIDVNQSACNLYGYTRQEMLDLYNADVSAQPEISNNALKVGSGLIHIPERKHKKKDGTVFTVEITGSFICQQGKCYALSIVHDITERKLLEAELAKTMQTLENDYSQTVEQMQTYFSELQLKKNELLRVQKENLQSQYESLKSQVNPHFLFNSLNVLNSLISVNPDLAEEFTVKLSKIYRYVLEHKSEDLVYLSAEMDFLKSYVFLLSIRFENKLKVNYQIPEEKLLMKLPPLSLQLLIENAIKHNSFSVKSPLNIDIFVDQDDYLNVVNNLQTREKQMESTGLGLKNIASRYGFFTEKSTFFDVEGGNFIARIPLL